MDAFIYWSIICFAVMGYMLIGLILLVRLNQECETAFDEVMGSTIAYVVGWVLWPLSFLLIGLCSYVGPAQVETDEHSDI